VNKRNLLALIIGTVVGVILILLWLNYIPVSELKVYFGSISSIHVLYASICYLAAYFVRSVRWNILLSQSIKIPIYRSWLYSMGGNLLNYMIPIHAGEFVKSWFVKRNHGQSMARTLPSVFIDKTFDTLAIVSVIILIPFLKIQVSRPLLILLILLSLVFIICVGLLFLATWKQDKVLGILSYPLRILPKRISDFIIDKLSLFIEGLNVFEQHPLKLIVAIVLTAIGIFLDGCYFYLLFMAFRVEFSFLLVLFGYTLINLSYALPQPPAQLGSNEWMMIIIFSIGFNLTKTSASAIMAFAHILTAILMLIFGSIAYGISGYEVIRMIFKGEGLDGKPDRKDTATQ